VRGAGYEMQMSDASQKIVHSLRCGEKNNPEELTDEIYCVGCDFRLC